MSQAELDPCLRATPTAMKEYESQAEQLSLTRNGVQSRENESGHAVEATFITPLDPVVVTSDGNRLPVVPIEEAHKFNALKDKVDGRLTKRKRMRPRGLSRFDSLQRDKDAVRKSQESGQSSAQTDSLSDAIPPSRTHPLFPPLPLYGPPSLMRSLQCILFRTTSFFLSTAFLLVIVLGALFTSIPKIVGFVWLRFTFRNPDSRRPFYEEECRRATLRKEDERRWRKQKQEQKQIHQEKHPSLDSTLPESCGRSQYVPLEGGPDPLICDARYYARRVGLDMEEFKVQTEDGFIITLWHVFDPSEYASVPTLERRASTPEVFTSDKNGGSNHNTVRRQYKDGQRRYPVLLMHGLLQSAGAYCSNDDDSLAFFLCKSGYDVWLGNNRCGFDPEHSLLEYKDPRMWAWNIRQMGVMDLPALISRVLEETGFERVGLVCHSQGTTETFVALAREQRPELGEKISVFCALAPAVYAGPLIGKMYFKFMRVISPAMFRVFFGIHAFIPLMMTMHKWLPGKMYGYMGYQVFSFLFNWSDTRWDRGLRDRLFQFSPVYVSSESMRWWLGRECFAKQKCILSTKEVGQLEDDQDDNSEEIAALSEEDRKKKLGRTAWYTEQMPPVAIWVAGSDDLVDGRRLLRRFERGHEPYVNIVHAKIIEEYEHLDVLWAVDAIEKVGVEVRDVLRQTMNEQERSVCRIIEGACDSDSEDEEDDERDLQYEKEVANKDFEHEVNANRESM